MISRLELTTVSNMLLKMINGQGAKKKESATCTNDFQEFMHKEQANKKTNIFLKF